MPTDESSRLRQARKELGFSQKDFASHLNMQQGSYSQIERGDGGISFKLMRKLINIFGINPNYIYLNEFPMLLKDKENPPSDTQTISSLSIELARKTEQINALRQAIETLNTRLAEKDEQIAWLRGVVEGLQKG